MWLLFDLQSRLLLLETSTTNISGPAVVEKNLGSESGDNEISLFHRRHISYQCYNNSRPVERSPHSPSSSPIMVGTLHSLLVLLLIAARALRHLSLSRRLFDTVTTAFTLILMMAVAATSPQLFPSHAPVTSTIGRSIPFTIVSVALAADLSTDDSQNTRNLNNAPHYRHNFPSPIVSLCEIGAVIDAAPSTTPNNSTLFLAELKSQFLSEIFPDDAAENGNRTNYDWDSDARVSNSQYARLNFALQSCTFTNGLSFQTNRYANNNTSSSPSSFTDPRGGDPNVLINGADNNNPHHLLLDPSTDLILGNGFGRGSVGGLIINTQITISNVKIGQNGIITINLRLGKGSSIIIAGVQPLVPAGQQPDLIISGILTNAATFSIVSASNFGAISLQSLRVSKCALFEISNASLKSLTVANTTAIIAGATLSIRKSTIKTTIGTGAPHAIGVFGVLIDSFVDFFSNTIEGDQITAINFDARNISADALALLYLYLSSTTTTPNDAAGEGSGEDGLRRGDGLQGTNNIIKLSSNKISLRATTASTVLNNMDPHSAAPRQFVVGFIEPRTFSPFATKTTAASSDASPIYTTSSYLRTGTLLRIANNTFALGSATAVAINIPLVYCYSAGAMVVHDQLNRGASGRIHFITGNSTRVVSNSSSSSSIIANNNMNISVTTATSLVPRNLTFVPETWPVLGAQIALNSYTNLLSIIIHIIGKGYSSSSFSIADRPVATNPTVLIEYVTVQRISIIHGGTVYPSALTPPSSSSTIDDSEQSCSAGVSILIAYSSVTVALELGVPYSGYTVSESSGMGAAGGYLGSTSDGRGVDGSSSSIVVQHLSAPLLLFTLGYQRLYGPNTTLELKNITFSNGLVIPRGFTMVNQSTLLVMKCVISRNGLIIRPALVSTNALLRIEGNTIVNSNSGNAVIISPAEHSYQATLIVQDNNLQCAAVNDRYAIAIIGDGISGSSSSTVSYGASVFLIRNDAATSSNLGGFLLNSTFSSAGTQLLMRGNKFRATTSTTSFVFWVSQWNTDASFIHENSNRYLSISRPFRFVFSEVLTSISGAVRNFYVFLSVEGSVMSSFAFITYANPTNPNNYQNSVVSLVDSTVSTSVEIRLKSVRNITALYRGTSLSGSIMQIEADRTYNTRIRIESSTINKGVTVSGSFGPLTSVVLESLGIDNNYQIRPDFSATLCEASATCLFAIRSTSVRSTGGSSVALLPFTGTLGNYIHIDIYKCSFDTGTSDARDVMTFSGSNPQGYASLAIVETKLICRDSGIFTTDSYALQMSTAMQGGIEFFATVFDGDGLIGHWSNANIAFLNIIKCQIEQGTYGGSGLESGNAFQACNYCTGTGCTMVGGASVSGLTDRTCSGSYTRCGSTFTSSFKRSAYTQAYNSNAPGSCIILPDVDTVLTSPIIAAYPIGSAALSIAASVAANAGNLISVATCGARRDRLGAVVALFIPDLYYASQYEDVESTFSSPSFANGNKNSVGVMSSDVLTTTVNSLYISVSGALIASGGNGCGGPVAGTTTISNPRKTPSPLFSQFYTVSPVEKRIGGWCMAFETFEPSLSISQATATMSNSVEKSVTTTLSNSLLISDSQSLITSNSKSFRASSSSTKSTSPSTSPSEKSPTMSNPTVSFSFSEIVSASRLSASDSKTLSLLATPSSTLTFSKDTSTSLSLLKTNSLTATLSLLLSSSNSVPTTDTLTATHSGRTVSDTNFTISQTFYHVPVPIPPSFSGTIYDEVDIAIRGTAAAAVLIADPLGVMQLDAVSSIMAMAVCSDANITVAERQEDRPYDFANNPLYLFIGKRHGAADRGAIISAFALLVVIICGLVLISYLKWQQALGEYWAQHQNQSIAGAVTSSAEDDPLRSSSSVNSVLPLLIVVERNDDDIIGGEDYLFGASDSVELLDLPPAAASRPPPPSSPSSFSPRITNTNTNTALRPTTSNDDDIDDILLLDDVVPTASARDRADRSEGGGTVAAIPSSSSPSPSRPPPPKFSLFQFPSITLMPVTFLIRLVVWSSIRLLTFSSSSNDDVILGVVGMFSVVAYIFLMYSATIPCPTPQQQRWFLDTFCCGALLSPSSLSFVFNTVMFQFPRNGFIQPFDIVPSPLLRGWQLSLESWVGPLKIWEVVQEEDVSIIVPSSSSLSVYHPTLSENAGKRQRQQQEIEADDVNHAGVVGGEVELEELLLGEDNNAEEEMENSEAQQQQRERIHMAHSRSVMWLYRYSHFVSKLKSHQWFVAFQLTIVVSLKILAAASMRNSCQVRNCIAFLLQISYFTLLTSLQPLTVRSKQYLAVGINAVLTIAALLNIINSFVEEQLIVDCVVYIALITFVLGGMETAVTVIRVILVRNIPVLSTQWVKKNGLRHPKFGENDAKKKYKNDDDDGNEDYHDDDNVDGLLGRGHTTSRSFAFIEDGNATVEQAMGVMALGLINGSGDGSEHFDDDDDDLLLMGDAGIPASAHPPPRQPIPDDLDFDDLLFGGGSTPSSANNNKNNKIEKKKKRIKIVVADLGSGAIPSPSSYFDPYSTNHDTTENTLFAAMSRSTFTTRHRYVDGDEDEEGEEEEDEDDGGEDLSDNYHRKNSNGSTHHQQQKLNHSLPPQRSSGRLLLSASGGKNYYDTHHHDRATPQKLSASSSATAATTTASMVGSNSYNSSAMPSSSSYSASVSRTISSVGTPLTPAMMTHSSSYSQHASSPSTFDGSAYHQRDGIYNAPNKNNKKTTVNKNKNDNHNNHASAASAASRSYPSASTHSKLNASPQPSSAGYAGLFGGGSGGGGIDLFDL